MMIKRKSLLFLIIVVFSTAIVAHPMPHSVLLLKMKEDGISATLNIPLKEFQIVFPNEDLDNGYKTLIQRKDNWLNEYLLTHFHITDPKGKPWNISIKGKSVSENEQMLTGKYHELTFDLWLQPSVMGTPRKFVMYYYVILHQLVTHKLFIKMVQDWDGGLTEKDSLDSDLGVLAVKTSDGTIPPIFINLDNGSKWKGFKSMFSLGIDHITEGADHLLFLLVLMLVAPLLVVDSKWNKSGGTRYSGIRLVKMATAFTIGHSITLLAGAVGWIRLPSQPVEILIALSILITAIHAIKPIFYGKEVIVTSLFGLIHGLAFANTLSELDLDAGRMAISILGFNLGIEAMQFFIILLVIPWLVILSNYHVYSFIRITGAIGACIASIAWVIERITEKPNIVSEQIKNISSYGKWIVLGLVVSSIISYFLLTKKQKSYF